MDQALVTIIIPFYNEEFLLSRAINSAISQTYNNIQILLINDGSTDNSKSIAEEFVTRYDNIELVNNDNQGLGESRNIGVARSRGELITFLDADDSLSDDMLEKMVAALHDSQSDIAISRFNLYDINKKKLKNFNHSGEIEIVNRIDAISYIYNHKVSSTAWGKLYKKSIIKNISAPKGIWFEDESFVLETLLNSTRVLIFDEPLINIYSRKGSIVRRLVTVRRIHDFNISFDLQLELLHEHQTILGSDFPSLLKGLFEYYYSRMLSDLVLILSDLKELSKEDKNEIKKSYLEGIKEANLRCQQNNVTVSLKTKIVVAILKMPIYFGWRITDMLMHLLKAEKFDRLKNLRGR